MDAIYTDIDRRACAVLRDLVDRGELPGGLVVESDIRSWHAPRAATVHWFAGVGGWPLALRLAGWPADRPVWTGSCPCQPFSQAGKRRGADDPRHLWPVWCERIAECRPPVLFGEQVASPDGRAWFAAVRADLEDLGYAVGCADLPAACAGAPHGRQRLFFVAHRHDAGQRPDRRVGAGEARDDAGRGVPARGAGPLGDGDGPCGDPPGSGRARGEAQAGRGRREDRRGGDPARAPGAGVRRSHAGSPWRYDTWVRCADGKARPIEPGTLPLADGVPNRMAQIALYGNAIVPQVAEVFVRAFMEAEEEKPWIT
ncbi:MAG TPA: DNA cytosine methyltransferase [Oceanithermus profundus]|uniref:DNA cytosine methyltransferase n=1 Tax=Oceanithermus profundus TaxID=187137 RepID=A0A7C5WWI3_9DEIN|nr:DNA cytosine methyltransferase [Oceanithermus profundus]